MLLVLSFSGLVADEKKLRGCRMKKILLVASICFLAMGGVVSAATIELPRTGQTTCYDAGGD